MVYYMKASIYLSHLYFTILLICNETRALNNKRNKHTVLRQFKNLAVLILKRMFPSNHHEKNRDKNILKLIIIMINPLRGAQ